MRGRRAGSEPWEQARRPRTRPVSPLSKGAAFSKRINLAWSPATALRGRSVKVDEGAVRLGGIPHPLVLLRAPALACARVTRVGRGSASPARRRAIGSPGQGSGGPSRRPAPWALTFADEHGDLPRHGPRTLRPCRPARGSPPGFPVHRFARLTPALVGGARVAAARALTRARPPRHAGASTRLPAPRPSSGPRTPSGVVDFGHAHHSRASGVWHTVGAQ